MATMFDPASYLDAAMEQPGERRVPFPVHNPDSADGLYLAEIGEVTAKAWESKNPEAKKKNGIMFQFQLKLQIGPLTKEATKFNGAEFPLTTSIMLDTTEAGQIDLAPGANRDLTMYREATGMNNKGETFRPRTLQGRPVKVQLEHEVYNNWPQERVKSVLKPS